MDGAPPRTASPPAMAGRTVLVTGGTTGIGRATAVGLAAMGARIVLTGRDPTRAHGVAEAVQKEARSGPVEGLGADLSRVQGVRALAEALDQVAPRIDVLVNNAGAVFSRYETTPEGLERTWALNVLAPFLLTEILVARAEGARPARVVNVASSAHRGAHLDLDDPGRSARYRGFSAYGQSKLALLLLTYAQAKRYADRHVRVNALHPGFVASRFGRDNPGGFGVGITIAEALFAISPQRGARTSIYLASAGEVGDATGRYFVRCRPSSSSRLSQDAALGERLWARCERDVAAVGPAPASEDA